MATTSHKKPKITRGQFVALIAIIAFIAIAIIYSIVTVISRNGKIATQVKFAPYNATITLNDAKIRNNSTAYLLPGKYHLKVSSNHFTDYEEDITISEDNNYIMGVLAASDEQGEDYINKHKIQFTTVEGFVGRVLNEQGEKFQKQYPVVAFLPINNAMYSITYTRETPESEPIITLFANDPEYLDIAAFRLQNFDGVEVETLQINFRDTDFSTDFSTSTESDARKAAMELVEADSRFSFSSAEELDDDYALVKLSSRNLYNQEIEHYRILLKKSNDGWKVTGQPQPLLTTKNNPDTPLEILKSANQK